MPSGYFPPQSVYPYGIDSDYTLFLVYNTSETVTTADNQPWSLDIPIQPVGATEQEMWGLNGFASIDGELFYYDTVDLDINGKVCALKRCARNLGGEKTKYTQEGTEVRGFVIAEHHNQLVDAVLKIENFVGEINSTNPITLDCRIRHLQDVPVIFDDFACPDLSFQFDILSSDPAAGTVAQYFITIVGNFSGFRLDFGDGVSTTAASSGTHTYAPSANIDPVVTVSNSNCQIVQTPNIRNNPNEPPQPTTTTPFEIPIPECPTIPPIVFPTIVPPSVNIIPPPIILPCLDISPIGPIVIPSVIMIEPPIDIPSMIEFGPVNIPSLIEITPVTIPSIIEIAPIVIPSLIQITPVTIPTLIEFGPLPSFAPIDFGPVTIPTLIMFGPVNVPTVVSFAPVTIPTVISFAPVSFPTVINFTPITIPTVINFTPIGIPTIISFTPVSFPTIISFSPVDIPTVISFSPVTIPTVISFSPVDIPTVISFSPVTIPTVISFSPVTIPTVISFLPVDIPTVISFSSPVMIPTVISFTSRYTDRHQLLTSNDPPTEYLPVDIPTVISFSPVTIPTVISFHQSIYRL